MEDGLNDGISRAGHELTDDIDVDVHLPGEHRQKEENADHNQHAIRRQPGGAIHTLMLRGGSFAN
jgi:hypothetical protein